MHKNLLLMEKQHFHPGYMFPGGRTTFICSKTFEIFANKSNRLFIRCQSDARSTDGFLDFTTGGTFASKNTIHENVPACTHRHMATEASLRLDLLHPHVRTRICFKLTFLASISCCRCDSSNQRHHILMVCCLVTMETAESLVVSNIHTFMSN